MVREAVESTRSCAAVGIGVTARVVAVSVLVAVYVDGHWHRLHRIGG